MRANENVAGQTRFVANKQLNSKQTENNGGDKDRRTSHKGGVLQLARNLSVSTHQDAALLSQFPPKQTLGELERVLTAAMCVIRSLDREGPIYCPNSLVTVFRIVNNFRYIWFLRLVALFHATALCALEVPPRLYSASDEEISNGGYYITFPDFVDTATCVLYIAHCVMLRLVDRAQQQRTLLTFNTLLYVIVGFLSVDALINLSLGYTVRPFRWLRPWVYVLLTPILRTMLQSWAATFAPLAKTFLVLIGAQVFYATMGLNLFSGYASKSNPFGAACLNGTGAPHPFQNFGWSYITMYIATTGDNHPAVIWPFFTCECSKTLVDTGQTFFSGRLEWCQTRKVIATCFFMSFTAIVFFCLGNCVLAVCYYFFDKISTANVTRSMIQQRLSIITAFYYLDKGTGSIAKRDFVAVSEAVSQLSNYPIKKVASQLFELLDPNNSGSLSLSEMFAFPDLVRTRLVLHRTPATTKRTSGCGVYARWKRSTLRHFMFNALQIQVFGMPMIELAIIVMMMFNFLFFTIESTRSSQWLGQFADLLIIIFVVEAVWKILAYGIQTYWIDSWNRFEFVITVISVGFYFYDQWVTSFTQATKKQSTSGLFGVIQCVRLLRMLKLFSFLLGGAQQDSEVGMSPQPTDSSQNSKPKHLKRRTREVTYFQKLLLSLATTIPVCVNILILLFLFMCSFALMAMEILSDYDTNTKVLLVGNSIVNYIFNNELKFDWADWSASVFSVVVIIVGNTWSSLLTEAMVRTRFGIAVFFLIFHFVGQFLILNIIQSLFVFAFSTLLDTDQFHQTIEAELAGQAMKFAANPNVKKVWRAPRLEYLMLTKDDLEDKYVAWKRKHHGSISVSGPGFVMPLSPRGFDVLDKTAPDSGPSSVPNSSPPSPTAKESMTPHRANTIEMSSLS